MNCKRFVLLIKNSSETLGLTPWVTLLKSPKRSKKLKKKRSRLCGCEFSVIETYKMKNETALYTSWQKIVPVLWNSVSFANHLQAAKLLFTAFKSEQRQICLWLTLETLCHVYRPWLQPWCLHTHIHTDHIFSNSEKNKKKQMTFYQGTIKSECVYYN